MARWGSMRCVVDCRGVERPGETGAGLSRCNASVGALVACLLLAPGALAQSPCAAVIADANPEVGYKKRGNHCEGLYHRPVAAEVNLSVIGAHVGEPNFAVASREAVAVRVPATEASGPLNLRIVSTKVRQYYRLDAAISAARGFDWPAEVRSHPLVQLKPADVRAMACAGSCDGNSPIILPLQLGNGRAVPGRVTISLTAAVDLSELRFSVMPEGSDKFLHKDVDVMSGRSVQLANTPIDLLLPLPPGQYRIKVTAVPSGRLAALDTLRFKLFVPR